MRRKIDSEGEKLCMWRAKLDPEWRERKRMSDDGKEEAAQFSNGKKVAEGRNGRRSESQLATGWPICQRKSLC